MDQCGIETTDVLVLGKYADYTFNWTSVVLKLASQDWDMRGMSYTFNWTSVVLKPYHVATDALWKPLQPFNWTSVVLKHCLL